jgi:hypothetical protein
LPEIVFDFLETLIRLGGSGNIYDVAAVSGYTTSTFKRLSSAIQARGWMMLPFATKHKALYVITERGKIAHAIEVGRRTKARALGRRFVGQTYEDFGVPTSSAAYRQELRRLQAAE